jgi:hypothetical protein
MAGIEVMSRELRRGGGPRGIDGSSVLSRTSCDPMIPDGISADDRLDLRGLIEGDVIGLMVLVAE